MVDILLVDNIYIQLRYGRMYICSLDAYMAYSSIPTASPLSLTWSDPTSKGRIDSGRVWPRDTILLLDDFQCLSKLHMYCHSSPNQPQMCELKPICVVTCSLVPRPFLVGGVRRGEEGRVW